MIKVVFNGKGEHVQIDHQTGGNPMTCKLCGANLGNKKGACTVWQRIGTKQNLLLQYITKSRIKQ